MRLTVVPLLCLIVASPAALQADLPSGVVSPKGQPKKSMKAHVRLFEKLDLDNDEILSPAELLEVTGSLDGSFVETNAVILAWFDGDGSGGIDLGEWQDGRTGNGDPDAPDLTRSSFHELDANGNGKVSRREFWKVITRYVPGKVTRKWYPAQFPGGRVTGSVSTLATNTMDWTLNTEPVGWLPLVPVGDSSSRGITEGLSVSMGSYGGSSSLGSIVRHQVSDPAAAAAWVASLPPEGESRLPAGWLAESSTFTLDLERAAALGDRDRRGSRETSGEP